MKSRFTIALPGCAVLGCLVLASGCSTMSSGGRGTGVALSKRAEPSVVLCMSERTGEGGIRLIGKLEGGVEYPITGVTLQHRTTGESDPVPAAGDPDAAFVGARSEKVPLTDTDSVTYTFDADAARSLRGKLLWYRWVVTYDKLGVSRTAGTLMHRTSLDEAGVPRDAGTPGPDAAFALPGVRGR